MRRALPILVLSIAAPVASAPGADKLTAGRWEIRTTDLSVALNGKVQPPDKRGLPPVEYKCMSAETAASPKTYFAKQVTNMCKPKNPSVSGGKINIQTGCTYGKGAAEKNSLTGTYTATSFRTAMKGANSNAGESMVISGKIEGKYVGECAGDEVK